jgi:hypothetical protein
MSEYTFIVLSVPTSGGGATPAATFAFGTQDYKPPRQGRSTSFDDVHNQNGRHRYVYDNGPGFRAWDPFRVKCVDELQTILGVSATQQHAQMEFLWNYIGPIGMLAPEGVYTVHWADSQKQLGWLGGRYPAGAGDKIAYDVSVAFEEGG